MYKGAHRENEEVIFRCCCILIKSIVGGGCFMRKFKIVLFLAIMFFVACSDEDGAVVNYRQEMRDFVIGISGYAKSFKTNFFIIPQNGIELVTSDGNEDGAPATAYLNAIDGHGQEDLLYGYENDDLPSPVSEITYLRAFLDISKVEGNRILVTDYCSTPTNMDDSYSVNESSGYISFAADQRKLTNIPTYPAVIHAENANNITNLSSASNFLYLINLESFASKIDFINAVTNSNYDLLIMDLFFSSVEFSSAEIMQLKVKANGGSRLVICYMSIGEAEDYRYYWQASWSSDKPAWLDVENPNWAGNYKVKYWLQEWQDIIMGNNSSYLKKIVDANFDGVYLDIIDGFEFYE